jgi:hypothetical protein
MLAPKAFESGQITLNQFQAQILNITNIPESLAVDPAMALNAEFKVMDKVSAECEFTVCTQFRY